MLVTPDKLTAEDGSVAHFVRITVGLVAATVLRAQWTVAPRGAQWASFGALSWSLPASVIADLRSALALPADIRIGIQTPATEAEVGDFVAEMEARPGYRFTRTGEVVLTVGCDADGGIRIREGWVNLKLILTGEECGWTPVASAAATSSTTVALAKR